jgi:hypothetical protein
MEYLFIENFPDCSDRPRGLSTPSALVFEQATAPPFERVRHAGERRDDGPKDRALANGGGRQ